jgi:hypothetical protein
MARRGVYAVRLDDFGDVEEVLIDGEWTLFDVVGDVVRAYVMLQDTTDFVDGGQELPLPFPDVVEIPEMPAVQLVPVEPLPHPIAIEPPVWTYRDAVEDMTSQPVDVPVTPPAYDDTTSYAPEPAPSYDPPATPSYDPPSYDTGCTDCGGSTDTFTSDPSCDSDFSSGGSDISSGGSDF